MAIGESHSFVVVLSIKSQEIRNLCVCVCICARACVRDKGERLRLADVAR